MYLNFTLNNFKRGDTTDFSNVGNGTISITDL